MQQLILGTRGSELALKQTDKIKQIIREHLPRLEMETRIIKTTGDKMREVSLSRIGSKGLFVKEIEEALLAGEIDVAVHSLKDLPTELPGGLVLGAVSEREDAREAWISPAGYTLDSMPRGGRVGTSSLRRSSQLLHYRPDLEMVPLRGNVHTRLRKAEDLDAVVMALAGLKRLGLEDRVTEILEPEICLPAVGQGALGLEIREGDRRVEEIVSRLQHRETGYRVLAERAFLRRLEGGCQVPVGAWARLTPQGSLVLTGMAAGISGSPFYREEITGPPGEAEELGLALAERLLRQGAGETLECVRREGEEENG